MPINVDLSKKIEVQLSKLSITEFEHKCQVQLVLDTSGSTGEDYQNGAYDQALNILAHTAFILDDNGKLETYVFSDDCKQLEDITQDNYLNYIKKKVQREVGGGTYYHNFIKLITEEDGLEYQKSESFVSKALSFFKSSNELKNKDLNQNEMPKLVFILTDGQDSNQEKTFEYFNKCKNYNIFWSFIGIGKQIKEFEFIEKLSKKFDNIGFTNIANLKKLSENEIIEALLNSNLSNWLNKDLAIKK